MNGLALQRPPLRQDIDFKTLFAPKRDAMVQRDGTATGRKPL